MIKRRCVAFTGSRTITAADEKVIAARLQEVFQFADRIVTGACRGVDSFIARYTDERCPDVRNIIVVPWRRDVVCEEVMKLSAPMFIYMAEGTSYRQRNETMVDISDEVEAFWKGDKRSGTFMTINIAKRKRKITEANIHMLK